MFDIEKIKKAQIISRRMFLMKYISERSGKDIYYLFGLLNMYNTKNRGRWFWQKAVFTGELKEDFDRLNSYMDNFSSRFRSYDEAMINKSLDEAQVLMEKLVSSLERSLSPDGKPDEESTRAYVDENMKRLIKDSLKGL